MMLSNPAFFSWLLVASLSLAILSVVYDYVFRNWTFFTINRWILLGGTCACLFPPHLSSQVMQGLSIPESAVHNFHFNTTPLLTVKATAQPGAQAAAAVPQSYHWLWILLTFVYWVGVAVMLARSLKALAQLRTIRSQSQPLESDSMVNVWIQSHLPTFSFGSSIFLNVQVLSLSPIEMAWIRRHEEGHVLQKHSIDNMFFEVICAVFWFNPFVKKLARHLRDVHEFLADRWATGPAPHNTAYQELLVSLASNAPSSLLAHPFSDSQFFRRIVMLNKPKTNAMESIKLLLLAPACAAAIFISACVDTDRDNPANPRAEIQKPASGPIISKITWTGNKLHSDGELNDLLGVKPGDRYNARLFQEMLFKGPLDKSVTSLYMDNGYLFFNTDVAQKLVDGKIELTVNISEDEQVWINDVTVKEKGGGKSLSEHVRPLLNVRKGQLFNRSLLISSQEKVAKSGLVNPDSVTINPYPLSKASPGGRKYVDIEFVVQNP
jgi:hypothetical protein